MKDTEHLGRLCKRGHEYENTGKTLRDKTNHCIECRNARSREYGKTEYRKEYLKQYSADNHDILSIKKKTYNKKHREKNLLYWKNRYSNNRDELLAQQKEYRLNNLDKVRARDRIRNKKRDSTIMGQINKRIRNGIRKSLTRGKDGYHWENLVGYTLADLKKHLEKQFTGEMTWDKFMSGEIHIDHIFPQSLFTFESYNDLAFKECWSLHNLQPLWASENISKGNRYIG